MRSGVTCISLPFFLKSSRVLFALVLYAATLIEGGKKKKNFSTLYELVFFDQTLLWGVSASARSKFLFSLSYLPTIPFNDPKHVEGMKRRLCSSIRSFTFSFVSKTYVWW